MNYLDIIAFIAIVVLGGLALYLKNNINVQKIYKELESKVTEFIYEAEEAYKDTTKAGGQKFEYVVNKLYVLVPEKLQSVITRDFVAELVQKTFDTIEAYAKLQLDKLTGEETKEEA